MAVAVHRVDMRKENFEIPESLCWCHNCGSDLRNAPSIYPEWSHDAAAVMRDQVLLPLENDVADNLKWDLASYSVMRQLCRIMTARYEHAKLRSFVLDQLGQPDIPLTGGHISFEMRPIEERHHLMQLVTWLLNDLPFRLSAAWRTGAIRYNLLLKDFPNPPDSYKKIIEEFSDWRVRIK